MREVNISQDEFVLDFLELKFSQEIVRISVYFPLKNIEGVTDSQTEENFLTMAFSTWQSDQSEEFSEVTDMNLIFVFSSEQCDFRHKDSSVGQKWKIEPK